MAVPNPDALIFTGQGPQEVGMGAELAATHPEAKETFDEADTAAVPLIGRKISELCFEGPKVELDRNTQIAMFTIAAATLAVLQRKGKMPRAVAGHSVGEYGALLAAGVFGAGAVAVQKGVRVMFERQEAMREADLNIPGGGGMGAIKGLSEAELLALAKEFDIDIAAANIPGEYTVTGVKDSVKAAVTEADSREGVKALMLNIIGAAHSRWQGIAADRMRPVLGDALTEKPNLTFFANNARELTSRVEIVTHLGDMFTETVRFYEMSQEMLKRGVRSFAEPSHANTLSKILKRGFGSRVEIVPLKKLIGGVDK